MEKDIAFLTFEAFHGRTNTAGSRIRAKWLMAQWPEAEEYTVGKRYDTIIYQKVYMPYFARKNKEAGVKQILDICDPDMYTRAAHDNCIFMDTVQHMDAVTCSTQALADQVKKYTDVPTYYVADRLLMSEFPQKKVHEGRAEAVSWFGYSHNSTALDLIKQKALNKYGLRLVVISDKPHEQNDEWVKWDYETFNEALIKKSDFCILPEPRGFMGRFKSNNRDLTAWALSMPVAKTIEDVERFLDADERKKEAELRLKEIDDKWLVKYSVDEMKEIIKSIK